SRHLGRDGSAVRDYLHVMELADGHTLALQALDPSNERHSIFSTPSRDLGFGIGKGKYKAYNLGTGNGVSAIGIIEAMKKATGVNFTYEVGPRRAGDVPSLIADPSLAEKELGFKAKKDLETMCRDLWNWQKGHPDGYES
ncbi:NAD(P)-binding protein, partial [Atractiella rhizophila]